MWSDEINELEIEQELDGEYEKMYEIDKLTEKQGLEKILRRNGKVRREYCED